MAAVTGEAYQVTSDDLLASPALLAEFFTTRSRVTRNQLAELHLPLVKFVARKMSSNLPSNVELDDLVAWGSLGLLDAIEKFDPSRGHQFSTYAVTRIRGEILDGLQRMEWAPKHVVSRVRAVQRAQRDLTSLLSREPTLEELAEKTELSVAMVRAAMLDDASTRLRPLAATEDGEEDFGSWLAQDGDDQVAGETAEIRSRMAAALNHLEPREVAVLHLYYAERLTLKEIAGHLGVSVSSATQSHTRLVDQVRHRLAAYGSVA